MLRFVQKNKIVRLLLPYVMGLLIPICNQRIWWSALLGALWVLLLFGYLKKRCSSEWPLRWMPGVCFTLIWLVFGNFSRSVVLEQGVMPTTQGAFFVQVSLVDPPVEKPKTFVVTAKVLATEKGFEAWNGKKIQLYFSKKWDKLTIADKLLVKIDPQPFAAPLYAGAFNYADWLHKKGICARSYVSPNGGRVYQKAARSNLQFCSYAVREQLKARFEHAGLQGEELALICALVLGSKGEMDFETKNAFSAVGISHILSVSGLHVGLIYGLLVFVFILLNPFKRFKILQGLIIVGCLVFYAFVTGLSPSVIRSVFMISMLTFGVSVGRKSNSVNTVLFTAFILLLLNPAYLWDMGFQLSYLAVLSLIVLYPKLTACWTPQNAIPKKLWELSNLSVSAQLGTAPLTIHLFHVFPNYFLLTNLIAVPFTSLLVYLGVAFLAFGSVPGVGWYLASLLNAFLHFFLKLTMQVSKGSFALTQGLHINTLEVVCLYGLLVGVMFCVLEGKRAFLIPTLFVALLCEVLFLTQLF